MVVEQIFDNVFSKLGMENPLSTDDIFQTKKITGLKNPFNGIKEAVKEAPKSIKNPLLAFARMLNERFSRKGDGKVIDSNDMKKIDKQLKKNGEIEIKPMSKRFTDDNVRAKNKKLFLDEYDGKNTVDIGSTAIGEPVRYNEETGEVWLRFKDKNGHPTGKWYHYTNMDKEQFKSFMRSSSKGRYVTKVMKYKTHDPAYGPTPIKKKK